MKYDVVIKYFPKKVEPRHLRVLRLVGKMTLKHVVDVARYASGLKEVTLISGIDEALAEKISGSLNEVGINAIIEASHSHHPMLLTPGAIYLNKWAFGMIVRGNKNVA